MTIDRTGYLNLAKPQRGTRNWDAYLNENADIIDTELNNQNNKDNLLSERIDNIVAQSGTDNTEIVDARYSQIMGTTYPTLQARLDDIEKLAFTIETGYENVYGIEVDIVGNIITRLAKSVGKTAGADFDNINAYKRRRCIVADDRTVLAYYGEQGYIETGVTEIEIIRNDITYPIGTHVQVMVEQPKFYYKRIPIILEKIQDGIGYHLRKWRDYISDYPMPGFKLHPNFYRNGVEYNYIYYPAFEGSIFDVSEGVYLLADEQVVDFTSTTGDKLCSIAGVKPASGLTQSLTRSNTRKLANNRGEGWQQLDILADYAEVMLMSIEYASFDMQTEIGKGVVDKASGEGNESETTGQTSSLGNNSGMAVGTNGLVSVSYRGRENPWGNIWKWSDGLNIECNGIHEAYWTDSGFIDNIKIEPYKPCGFTLAKSNGYVSAIGWSEDCDFMYIPSETLGASNRPLNDYFYQNAASAGFLVARLGGLWTVSLNAGPCCLGVHGSSGDSGRLVGGGLLCLPKTS